MRQFKMYFVPKDVVGFDFDSDSPSSVSTRIFIGHKMQDLLLSNKVLRSQLGFIEPSYIYSLLEEGALKPTFIELFSANDAARIGVIREFSLTLIPVDATKTVRPFDLRYSTSISYSSLIPPAEAAAFLYKATWDFGIINSSCFYMVLPNSVKDKRKKANTPTYS